MQVFDRDSFDNLLNALKRRGYTTVGPTVRDDAIIYDEIVSSVDLPIGWTDEQNGGTYRLRRRDDAALFGYAVGPHSWKKYLHPPRARLLQLRKDGPSFEVVPEPDDAPRMAFIGVRSCELHAIAIQDRVLVSGGRTDPVYEPRRNNVFIVAVQCGQAGGTCFCVSMETGPKASSGFDLALTEVIEGDRHYFVAEAGTDAGGEVLRDLASAEAGAEEVAAADRVVARTAEQMGRTMDTAGIKDLLYANLDHPRWDNVAERCLTCANCTMACPTCFCTTVEDVTDLSGDHAERWRRWDSCFTLDFSYIHGGTVRSSVKSRYRQWMTHKLASWQDQFGSSGCVGCGRCITWCPVAIDITEEVRKIREAPG